MLPALPLLLACTPPADTDTSPGGDASPPTETTEVPDPVPPTPTPTPTPTPPTDTVTEPTPPTGPLLASLSTDSLILAPAFDALTFHYDAALVAGLVDIVAVAEDPAAVVTVHQHLVEGDLVQTGGPFNLLDGPRIIADVSLDGETTEYEILVLPPNFPDFGLDVEGVMAGAFYVGTLGPGASTYALRTDAKGAVTWYEAVPDDAYDVRQSPSGNVTWVGNEGGVPATAVRDPNGWAVLANWVPALSETGRPLTVDVHEFVELSDDAAIVMGHFDEPMDLSPYGGPAEGFVKHMEFQELNRAGDVVFRWSTESVFVPEQIDTWMPVDPLQLVWDYVHANAVEVDPNDGNWLISLRLMNAVLKVARNDTEYQGSLVPAGEVMWQLGGDAATLQFVDDPRDEGWEGFAGIHSPRMVGVDRLLVYDNALGRDASASPFVDEVDFFPTGGSRAVEYALDHEAGTATPVWSYDLADGVATNAGGSAQRLADGSTVIGWGTRYLDAGGPAMTWVSPTGTVWSELSLPSGVWSYRVWYAAP